MSANLVANVTITGNLTCFSTLSSSTANAATGFAIGGPYINASYGARVAGGQYHTAVIMNDGSIQTFGRNLNGQLGVGADTSNKLAPLNVYGITRGAIAVSSGFYHTAVLLTNGTVRTFGGNNNGQLGVNDTTTRFTPVTVLNIVNATSVACGNQHTAVLLVDGTVRTFGLNTNGQLGISVSGGTRQTPVQVWGISSSATAIACGSSHAAVLLADGTVKTFGINTYGQLGIDVAGGSRETPVQVLNITSATAVACGSSHTAVLLVDGTVRTFGLNGNGELGINVAGGTRQTPVQVFGISSSAVAVACGSSHTAVLLANGTVRTFGYNLYGQLGDNTLVTKQTPVQVWTISSSAVAIAGGAYHTAVLLADGTVRTFGANNYGQLGDNTTVSKSTPVQVIVADSRVLKVAGGGYHSVVLLQDGTVRTFGRANAGQLGVNDGSTATRATPVTFFGVAGATAVAAAHDSFGFVTFALRVDGTVVGSGGNTYGGLGVGDTGQRFSPTQTLNITSAISMGCGDLFTAVLLADGTVRTFGRNDVGQLGINLLGASRLTPVTVQNISTATAVACGGYFSAVILPDGRVMTWGGNGQGQLGVNDTTARTTPVQVFGISSSATAVAGGFQHFAVLLADGTVRTFGSNGSGQLGIDVAGGSRGTPVQVLGITSATAVVCGSQHTAILLADGTIRTFGINDAGQLGIDVAGGSRQTPVQVLGITNATSVAGGFRHTLVVLPDGTVRTFGRNDFGQLGVNDTTSRQTPVTVLNITSAFSPRAGFLTSAATSITLAASAGRIWTSSAIGPYPTYVTAQALSLGLSAPTFQLDLSTDGARKLSTTTWTTGSDQRIKSDIQSANLARCVDIVDSLDLKYFKWDIPGVAGPTDSHSLGWIAQEVKEFFPNSVRETQDYGFDDFHNLDSDQLIKTMYGALKKMCSDTYGQ